MDRLASRIIVGLGGVAALMPGSASASVVVVPVNSGFTGNYSTTVVGHPLSWAYVFTAGPSTFYDPNSGTYVPSYYAYDTDLLTGSGLSFTTGALQPFGTTFGAADTYISSEMVQEKVNTTTLNGGSFIQYNTTFNGPWTSNTSGYVGLAIDIGGQTHYGWAQFQTFNLINELNFIAYGYDTTPNEAVAAGSSAVPEPASLALLAGGLAGITRLRRRRKN